MILEVGSKLLVVHRRLFENDKSRYFIGKVEHCEDAVARVSGHTWVWGQTPYIRLDPHQHVAHIVHVRPGAV